MKLRIDRVVMTDAPDTPRDADAFRGEVSAARLSLIEERGLPAVQSNASLQIDGAAGSQPAEVATAIYDALGGKAG